jgi:hypothetical protein
MKLPWRTHMSYVILRNGKAICATRTYDTLEEAVDMVRMLEYDRQYRQHSPYTIMPFDAYMEGK